MNAPDRTHSLTVELLAARQRLADLQRLLDEQRALPDQFRAIVECAQDGIVLCAQDGTIVEWNDAQARISGLIREEVCGRSLWAVMSQMAPEELRQPASLVEQSVQRSLQTGQIPWSEPLNERVIERPDGSRRLVEKLVFAIDAANGRMLCSVCRDITGHMQAVEALRQSEWRYRTLVENIPIGVYRTTPGPTGRFLTVNPAFVHIFGFETAQETEAVDVADLYACPAERQAFSDRLLVDGSVSGVEIQFRRRDGSLMWGSVTARVVYDESTTEPVYFDCSIEDVTARKQAQEALQQYAVRLEIQDEIDRAILAAQWSPAIAEAALQRIYRLIPCRASAALGFDLQGSTVHILAVRVDGQRRAETAATIPLHPQDVQWFEQNAGQATRDIPALARELFAGLQLDEKGIVDLLTVPLVAYGQLIGALIFGAHDSSPFTPAHVGIACKVGDSLAVALCQAQLHEQTRRDARTKALLLSDINHRVRNNLSAIIGMLYTELGFVQKHPRSSQAEMIREMIGRVEGLAATHQLLTDSEWGPLALSELVERIVRPVMQALPSGKRIVLDVPASPVRVNPKQANDLALVINELTTNTVKHALRERNVVRVTVGIARQGDVVELTFHDDGPGYPQDVLLQQRYEVGLYLVRRLVCDELGGELALSNCDGSLTTIRFGGDER